jgi:RNA polymerase sigma factor (sigma-70 family)
VAALDPHLGALLAQWDRLICKLANQYARALDADADDLRSDIVLALIEYHPRYDPQRSAFPTWLGVVAKSVYGHAVARRMRSVRLVSGVVVPGRERDGDDDLFLFDATADPGSPDPVETAETAEQVERLLARVAALPPAQRAAVRARFWKGAGGPGSCGRDQLARALDALRDQLAPT